MSTVKMHNFLSFSAILRECFPISVLLGDFQDPLTPEDECRPRDISEPGTSGEHFMIIMKSFYSWVGGWGGGGGGGNGLKKNPKNI
jgi:hypothetical protein